MKVSKGMISRGASVRRGIQHQTNEDYVEDVLTHALVGVEAEPFGTIVTYDPKSPPSAEFPFRLSDEEERAVKFFESVNNFVGGIKVKDVAAIVRRAVRTLAAPQVEPLSAEEEETLRQSELGTADPIEARLKAIIRRRFPKPAPKTPAELAHSIVHCATIEERDAALAELVRRAEGK